VVVVVVEASETLVDEESLKRIFIIPQLLCLIASRETW